MAVWEFSPILPLVLSIKNLKGLEEMKKYQIIGFTLWTLGNILLILRMWDYILIAPVLAVQVAVWICCSVLFCIDISSRELFIAINTTLVITGLLGILYFLYYRNPIGVITLIAVFAVNFKNFVFGRKRKKNCFVTKMFATLLLIVMLLSILFTSYIFVTERQSGYSNGLATSWSIADEKFFNELAKDCTTDEETVKAGYKWITENIEYDYAYDPVYQYFNSYNTLQTKKGVCYDFAHLFAAYCRSQGIPCYVVDGNCKTNRAAKHSWNRVYFNGSWWNIDVTNDAVTTEVKYGFYMLTDLNEADMEYIITRIY